MKNKTCCEKIGEVLLGMLLTVGAITVCWGIGTGIRNIFNTVETIKQDDEKIEELIQSINDLNNRLNTLSFQQDNIQGFLAGKKWDDYIKNKPTDLDVHGTLRTFFMTQ